MMLKVRAHNMGYKANKLCFGLNRARDGIVWHNTTPYPNHLHVWWLGQHGDWCVRAAHDLTPYTYCPLEFRDVCTCHKKKSSQLNLNCPSYQDSRHVESREKQIEIKDQTNIFCLRSLEVWYDIIVWYKSGTRRYLTRYHTMPSSVWCSLLPILSKKAPSSPFHPRFTVATRRTVNCHLSTTREASLLNIIRNISRDSTRRVKLTHLPPRPSNTTCCQYSTFDKTV
jgi:hypothetical protein